jgi:hypothetical protein
MPQQSRMWGNQWSAQFVLIVWRGRIHAEKERQRVRPAMIGGLIEGLMMWRGH